MKSTIQYCIHSCDHNLLSRSILLAEVLRSCTMQLNYLQTAKKGTDSQFIGFLHLNIDHVVCHNHSDNPE